MIDLHARVREVVGPLTEDRPLGHEVEELARRVARDELRVTGR